MKQDKLQFIKELREQRFTYREIGNLLGVSKQRIHQILTGYHTKNKISFTEISDNWRPGKIKELEYSLNGGRDNLKEKIRARDNWTCQICRKKWKKGQRRLDVHHLDEKLEGKNGLKYSNNKCFDRMITLCHKCHLRLRVVRKKMGVNK